MNKRIEPDALPPEIVGLKLKYIKVKILDDSWEKLSESERANVVSYLQQYEADRRERKAKGVIVVKLQSEKLVDQSDDDVSALEQEVSDNNADLARGKHRIYGAIGVNQTKREVPISELERGMPETTTLEAGSTFPSAKYQAKDMNNDAFGRVMEEAAATVQRLRDAYGPDVGITLTIESSESQVTPPKGMEKGQLAEYRANTAESETRAYFAAAGIDTDHIVFDKDPKIGPTPYYPKWKNPEKHISPHDPIYTAEQYLRIHIELNGQPPPKIEEGDPVSELEVVKIRSGLEDPKIKTTKRRGGRGKGGGGKSFVGKKFSTTSCT